MILVDDSMNAVTQTLEGMTPQCPLHIHVHNQTLTLNTQEPVDCEDAIMQSQWVTNIT